MAELSRRSFLEKIIVRTVGGLLATEIGVSVYYYATRPQFPDYLFHGEIDGEHLALYRGRTTPVEDLQGHRSQDLVLEVTLADKTATDAHPAIYNKSNDIITNFVLENPMNISKHLTVFYLANRTGKFFDAVEVENGIVKGSLADKMHALKKFEDYKRKIREQNPTISFE